jgi:methylmalonyl-CoA mutase
MTCFKKKAGQIKIFWRWRWRNFAFRNSRITSVWNHQIYAPDDGRAMGLQGMINDLVQQSDFPTGDKLTNELDQLELKNPTALRNHISS